jgi:hypothetical protein
MSFLDRLFGKKAPISSDSPSPPAQSSSPAPPSTDASAVNEIVRARGGAGALLSLEEFFTDNDDLGSIGCNLNDHPGVNAFSQIFLSIRERPDVSDVRVAIRDFADSPEEWPFSDTVYVVTSASVDEIAAIVESLQPDEVQIDDTAMAGQRVVSVWWD